MSKKNKPKDADNKLTAKALQTVILKLYRDNPKKRYTASNIIKILNIGNNKDSVQHALDQLAQSGQLDSARSPKNADAADAGVNKGYARSPKNADGVNKDFARSPKNADAVDAGVNNDVSDQTRKTDVVHASEKKGKYNQRNQSEKGAGKSSEKSNRDRGRDGRPPRTSAGKYEGKVDMTKSGAAYIVCEALEDDVFVHASKLNGALNDDKVLVSVFPAAGRRRRAEGEVLQVLHRATDHFIGTFRKKGKYALVLPDTEGLPDIYVELEDTREAKEGEKVVVRVTKWLSRANRKLVGVVTSVLGKPGTSDIEMKSILISNGFNIDFPEDVTAESEKISDNIASEVPKRRDFRSITTFTIDPIDAKDFDDALSYQVLDNGNVEVGVHIADVTHYILPQSALDKEAYLRSTSVYLVDRVCPMLPERLSNGLCSLRPHEEKLTFSAVFEFDDKMNIVKKWFGKTIIYSDRRFSYEEVQDILEKGEGDFVDELIKLNQIAHHLRKKRFKDGSINFETDEVRFKLDENGEPIEVYVKVRKDAHLLIEDFMLLANRSVAEFMAKKEKNEVPYVYRIHDLPNMDKLEDFSVFARELGVKMQLDTPKNIAKSLNEMVKKAEADETLKLLMPIAIRTMAKAEYSTDNIGHYGLAFEYYSHFTSPIRRYSDVLAHRVLFDNLDKTNRYDKEKLDEQCKHISAQERKAADAERQSVKYKQVEYMKKHIGDTFEGVISGMLERGIFVEIKGIMAEGMVGFDKMSESFELEANRLRARGRRTGKILKMGDAVKVRILSADLDKKQIEMMLHE